MVKTNNTYKPKPIETSDIILSEEIHDLVEFLAENNHDNWALGRIMMGWQWGPKRDDDMKFHPDLVPYIDLPEEEKEFDRKTAIQALKLVIKAGYKISKQ